MWKQVILNSMLKKIKKKNNSIVFLKKAIVCRKKFNLNNLLNPMFSDLASTHTVQMTGLVCGLVCTTDTQMYVHKH